MSRMLILQLERFGKLEPEEKLALNGVTLQPRRLPALSDFSREAEQDGRSIVLLTGVACRYVTLPGGQRQILAYLLPGDFCDRYAGDRVLADHAIGSLSGVQIVSVLRDDISRLKQSFPRIARALELSRSVEQATLRQWLSSLGNRNALERTAHLLCELFVRLRALGLAQGRTCVLPLRQADLADALALSAVHLNRTLREIRRRKLAIFVRHQLGIWDWRALQAVCAFRPDYLFAGAPPRFDESRDDLECGPAEVPLRTAKQGEVAPDQKEMFQV